MAMEAVAEGVPVVASPAGDVADVVRDGLTGYLLKNQTPEELAALIERVLTDERLRERVRETGRAEMDTIYPVENTVNILMDTYKSLLR